MKPGGCCWAPRTHKCIIHQGSRKCKSVEEEELSGVKRRGEERQSISLLHRRAFLQHPSTSSWISGVKKSRELLHRSSWYSSARTGQQREVSGVRSFIFGNSRDQMLGCWSDAEYWSVYISSIRLKQCSFVFCSKKVVRGCWSYRQFLPLCKNLVFTLVVHVGDELMQRKSMFVSCLSPYIHFLQGLPCTSLLWCTEI